MPPQECPLRRTRLLLVDFPRILGEVVTDVLESQDDFEVVDQVDVTAAAETVERRSVEFVAIGRDDAELAGRLLVSCPRLNVLGFIDDGRDAALYELRPRRVLVGELSPESFVALIRSTVGVRRRGRA